MAARKTQPAAVASEVPPFYEAARDIYLGSPESGAMPVAAFRAGDRVPVDIVELHDLGMLVKVPDSFVLSVPESNAEPSTTDSSSDAAAATADASESASEAGKE